MPCATRERSTEATAGVHVGVRAGMRAGTRAARSGERDAFDPLAEVQAEAAARTKWRGGGEREPAWQQHMQRRCEGSRGGNDTERHHTARPNRRGTERERATASRMSLARGQTNGTRRAARRAEQHRGSYAPCSTGGEAARRRHGATGSAPRTRSMWHERSGRWDACRSGEGTRHTARAHGMV